MRGILVTLTIAWAIGHSSAPSRAALAGEVVPPGELATVVEVEGVRTDADAVRGRLVNHTDDRVVEVRVMIEDNFYWNNELHPGIDNPSHADVRTLTQEIPPRGSVPFGIDRAPLPPRPDGHFETAVSVIAVTIQPTR